MVTKFEKHLSKSDLSKNTVTSYVWTVAYFLAHYKEINSNNLLAYKGYLLEKFKPPNGKSAFAGDEQIS